ncbi:hypothetical protein [Paenibacillus sp. KN14-4R]|uniref:hypothetical protein n=1 Tax=Paenibacillus sp. KN14-4R TaxID=3445773 RepID=UPI003FA0EE23
MGLIGEYNIHVQSYLIGGQQMMNSLITVIRGRYSDHFQDPDGHLWEVAWNPEWEREELESNL